MPTIMEIEQGSPEWLEMKFTHFGGSYAPIIMGHSLYSTPYQLWHKILFRTKDKENFGMSRGKELEPVVRAYYEKKNGVKLTTPVVQSTINPLLIASLDGCACENGVFSDVIEIKCFGTLKHSAALEKKEIPQEIYHQLVHIMYVLDIPGMTYISFNPEFGEHEYVEIPVPRDPVAEDIYLRKLKDFIRYVEYFEEPPRSDKDYYDATKNPHWIYLEHSYLNIDKQMKELEFRKKKIREALIEEANGLNIRGNFLQLTSIRNKGHVKYDLIPELKEIDLEQYRGPSFVTHRIMEMKNDSNPT